MITRSKLFKYLLCGTLTAGGVACIVCAVVIPISIPITVPIGAVALSGAFGMFQGGLARNSCQSDYPSAEFVHSHEEEHPQHDVNVNLHFSYHEHYERERNFPAKLTMS